MFMSDDKRLLVEAPNGMQVWIPASKIGDWKKADHTSPLTPEEKERVSRLSKMLRGYLPSSTIRPSDISAFDLESALQKARTEYPFHPSFIGLKNPYTGLKVNSAEDYDEYLREHCYHEHCDASVRSLKAELDKANMEISEKSKYIECLKISNQTLRNENASLVSKMKEFPMKSPHKKPIKTAAPARKEKWFSSFRTSFRANWKVYLLLASMVCSLLLIVSMFISHFISDDSPAPTQTTIPTRIVYFIGNANSKIVHASSCRYLPDFENQVMYFSLEEALDDGFTPCRHCNPRE